MKKKQKKSPQDRFWKIHPQKKLNHRTPALDTYRRVLSRSPFVNTQDTESTSKLRIHKCQQKHYERRSINEIKETNDFE